MVLNKLIFEIREATGSISDDRRIDDRYITHLIDNFRADYIRKLVSRKPYFNTSGLAQTIQFEFESVSRSTSTRCPANCSILKSNIEIPTLVYEGTLGNWYDVRPVNILERYLEIIEPERAAYITFEFNVVYIFLNPDYYLYAISEDNFDLSCAEITGIFESPLEADPKLTDYPIKQDIWAAIKPGVVNSILQIPLEDPINNSEQDRQQVQAKQNDRQGTT